MAGFEALAGQALSRERPPEGSIPKTCPQREIHPPRRRRWTNDTKQVQWRRHSVEVIISSQRGGFHEQCQSHHHRSRERRLLSRIGQRPVPDHGLVRERSPLHGHQRGAAGHRLSPRPALRRGPGRRSALQAHDGSRGGAAGCRFRDRHGHDHARRALHEAPPRAGRSARLLLRPHRHARMAQPAADARRGPGHGGHLPGRVDPAGRQSGVRGHDADDPRDLDQGVRAVPRPLRLSPHREGAGPGPDPHHLAGARPQPQHLAHPLLLRRQGRVSADRRVDREQGGGVLGGMLGEGPGVLRADVARSDSSIQDVRPDADRRYAAIGRLVVPYRSGDARSLVRARRRRGHARRPRPHPAPKRGIARAHEGGRHRSEGAARHDVRQREGRPSSTSRSSTRWSTTTRGSSRSTCRTTAR